MTITRSLEHIFDQMLQTFAQCSSLFVRAMEEERIYFDDRIVSTGLEIVSKITSKAAQLDAEAQQAFLLHLQEDGVPVCQEVIARVERRSPPVMHRDDLVAVLLKDEDGAEYRQGRV